MTNYQNNMRYSRCSIQNMQQMRTHSDCCRKTNGCPDTQTRFPASPVVAMSYVPWQKWEDIYEAGRGLECGTIFRELDKPFLGKGGRRK